MQRTFLTSTHCGRPGGAVDASHPTHQKRLARAKSINSGSGAVSGPGGSERAGSEFSLDLSGLRVSGADLPAEGDHKLVRLLMENGAKTLIKDRWGGTPYDDAQREGFPKVLAALQEEVLGTWSKAALGSEQATRRVDALAEGVRLSGCAAGGVCVQAAVARGRLLRGGHPLRGDPGDAPRSSASPRTGARWAACTSARR